MKYKQLTISISMVLLSTLGQFCSKKDTITVPIANTDGIATTTSIKGPVLPAVAYNYSSLALPAYLAASIKAADNMPATNPITNEGATLGRVLFYDSNLSKTNTVSCGSCHQQSLSFGDSAILSKGFQGGSTTRHSMGLLNVRYYQSGKMFWDERANTLEEQVLQPIQNTVEMGLTLPELVTKIQGISYYPALFNKAFGSTEITTDKIAKALAQFVRSIVTYQSKYDQVKQGLANFTADESAGEQIFLTTGRNTCAGCHAPPLFLTSSPVAPFALADANDKGINNQNRFKAGSLRNTVLRAPYFHNGSVNSLTTMLNSNIPSHNAGPQDRVKLLAFLQTLTDQTIITDVKYANPFK